MPTYPTLLDMAIRNGRDRAVPLIEETSHLIPEISGVTQDGTEVPGVGTVRTIKGTNYKTLVRVTNPSVGFRDANEPSIIGKGTYENRTVETYILNPRWECDKAVADRSEDGPDAYISDEAIAIMEAVMQWMGYQFFYGRGAGNGGVGAGNDPKGFPGLIDAINAAYTITAGGTAGGGATNNPITGGPICGSVWAVKFGVNHVSWIYGENGTLAIPDKRIETIYRVPTGGSIPLPLDGYVQSLLAYPGVQVGSTRSIGRIKFITQEAGHTMTDALGFQLLAAMKVRPDVLFMPKVILEQLRESRTAVNPTGAPAPRPTEIGGVPIAPTESLLLNETV